MNDVDYYYYYSNIDTSSLWRGERDGGCGFEGVREDRNLDIIICYFYANYLGVDYVIMNFTDIIFYLWAFGAAILTIVALLLLLEFGFDFHWYIDPMIRIGR